ncbi:MAG: tRNA (adenosine(37)-N6)-threonylcarbamoyltransferase complex dimerization subunit type 1 TsaB [Planctomycetota bacterium]|nr:tRNA (adenosine(37)-N6)-threonylcarbamoyltransferase complex dimerization subunit type 1 TsaB [Planctomycetota bacterium]
MRFLAIETSGARGSLALFEGGRCLDEMTFPEGLVQSREIASGILELSSRKGVKIPHLEGIAVGQGPGSYTGSRVGVTAAKTLGFALKIPVVAVSSLEVLARGAVERARLGAADREAPITLAPILDGRRGFFYGAAFACSPPSAAAEGIALRRSAPDRVGRPADIRELLAPGTWLLGDGADPFLEALGGDPFRETLGRTPRECDLPSARALGEIAATLFADRPFDEEALHRLEPAYLRPSEPEILLDERRRREAARGTQGSEDSSSSDRSAGVSGKSER